MKSNTFRLMFARGDDINHFMISFAYNDLAISSTMHSLSWWSKHLDKSMSAHYTVHRFSWIVRLSLLSGSATGTGYIYIYVEPTFFPREVQSFSRTLMNPAGWPYSKKTGEAAHREGVPGIRYHINLQLFRNSTAGEGWQEKGSKVTLDRGFYSNENVNELYKNNQKFIIGDKLGLNYLKEVLDRRGRIWCYGVTWSLSSTHMAYARP